MLALVLAGIAIGGRADVQPIAGGQAAQECEWPTVVAYRVGDRKCTGVLVHPEVMLTAAHCLEDGPTGRVRLGEQFSPHRVRLDVASCVANPAYLDTRAPADDVAVCRLAEPADGVPIVPIAMGCDEDAIREGTTVVIAGFGQSPDGEFGVKRWATTTIADATHEVVTIGDATTHACLGDSGGPAFVQMRDATWRVIGVFSAGYACGEGPATYARTGRYASWIEAQIGIDVTPCHTADGQDDPGPACRGFAIDPLFRSTWEAACDAPRVDPSGRCPVVDEPETGGSSDDGDTVAAADGAGCRFGARRPGALLLLVVVLFARRRHVHGVGRRLDRASPRAVRRCA